MSLRRVLQRRNGADTHSSWPSRLRGFVCGLVEGKERPAVSARACRQLNSSRLLPGGDAFRVIPPRCPAPPQSKLLIPRTCLRDLLWRAEWRWRRRDQFLCAYHGFEQIRIRMFDALALCRATPNISARPGIALDVDNMHRQSRFNWSVKG